MSCEYRRAHLRFPAQGSAEITAAGLKKTSLILNDLSAGGANLVTNIPFDLREKVEILFRQSIFFNAPVSKSARVAWCREFGRGLWQVGLDFGVDKLFNLSGPDRI